MLIFKYKLFVYIYINNIIIFSNIIKKHLEHLYIVLNIFNKAKVYISIAKLFVAFLLVQLLKYNVNSNKILCINNNIKSFCKLKMPCTLKALKTYIKIAS